MHIAVFVVPLSLETEQFRFRFEMDVDRTHSRAFAAAAANTEADSISEDVHARKWPRVVGNRGEMSFMQSIHVYSTRISENHRASSMGAWNFETRIVRSHSQSFPIWPRFDLIAYKSTSFVASVFSYQLKMAVGYDQACQRLRFRS